MSSVSLNSKLEEYGETLRNSIDFFVRVSVLVVFVAYVS